MRIIISDFSPNPLRLPLRDEAYAVFGPTGPTGPQGPTGPAGAALFPDTDGQPSDAATTKGEARFDWRTNTLWIANGTDWVRTVLS